MSGPYSVIIDRCGDHQTYECQTFDEALALAVEKNDETFWPVRVFGDGHEAETFSDGSVKVHDGLSESERERLEEAGL